jgi:hypothetical protein
MTLKEWKVSNTWKKGKSWEHKDKYYNQKFVQVYNDSTMFGKWRFEAHAEGRIIEDEYFENKNKAIAHAMKYMEDN